MSFSNLQSDRHKFYAGLVFYYVSYAGEGAGFRL